MNCTSTIYNYGFDVCAIFEGVFLFSFDTSDTYVVKRSTNGSATTYDLTDAQGSVLLSLSASAVTGEQVYDPYGNQRYTQAAWAPTKATPASSPTP